LDHLVEEAKRVGALGAKLTGAGGGGCVIALCDNKASRLKVAKRLKQEGGRIYNVALAEKGVE
jgi:mevalonate kinase